MIYCYNDTFIEEVTPATSKRTFHLLVRNQTLLHFLESNFKDPVDKITRLDGFLFSAPSQGSRT